MVPTEIVVALITLVGTLVAALVSLAVSLGTSRRTKNVEATLTTKNSGSHIKDQLDRLESVSISTRDDVVQMRIGQAVLGEQITRNAGDIERLRGNIARIHERIDTTE